MPANLTTKLGQLVDVLTPDTTNTRIGVANASPTRTLDVTGTGAISTSLAIGGATIGTNAIAVTGTSALNGLVTATKASAGDSFSWTNGGATPKTGFLYSDSAVVGIFNVAGAGAGRNGFQISSTAVLLDINAGTNIASFTSTGLIVGTSSAADVGAITAFTTGAASSEINIVCASGTGSKESILNFGSTLTGTTRYSGRITYFHLDNTLRIYAPTTTNSAITINSSGALQLGGSTSTTGKLNISNGSVYLSTSGVGNTAGPVSITIPSDTDGFILLNAVQSGVGKVSYIVHYMNVSGTVTSNTVSTLVTGTSPITAITPGTNVITLTLFAANTNVNWGMYNGPRG